MRRIADFFAPPQPVYQPITHIPNQQPLRFVEQMVQRQQPVPQPRPVEPVIQGQPEVILVDRNDNADEVVRNVQQQNKRAHNNIANLVKNIMSQNGLNIGFHRTNFVSPSSELVLQSELPMGYKIPKFTKFVGDTSESTVEHIERYLPEAGDLANDENLRLKLFPNSHTKNVFTWFTTLARHSIQHWTELERLLHEKFYMGQSKISLKELASIKRNSTESIDDYLNRFRLLKARCFTQVPEHELVEMGAGGLDYSIRKKLDTQNLRDMAHLADRVRHVEILKAEKSKTHKHFKKVKVAYIPSDESNQEFDITFGNVEIKQVDIAELKPRPPYTCKSLRPSDGNNPVETSNERYPMTYTFDVTKCDEIYDLLVAYGQVVVPKDVKIPPLEQRQKRGFSKYHKFLGHNTSRCSLLRVWFIRVEI